MACWLCPSREEVGIWIPNRSPAKGQRHTSCRIQILLIHKPATDIRESAQPASTPYSASTNKEPPRHLLKQQQSHTSCYTSWSRGHYLHQYTITPLLNLGVPTHKVHQLATKLHCHAIKSLNKITKTRHKIHLNNNSDNGGSDGGFTGRAAGFRRARHRPNRMADNPPDPH